VRVDENQGAASGFHIRRGLRASSRRLFLRRVRRRGAGVLVDRQRCARRFSRFDNRHFGVPAGKVSDRLNPTPDFPTDRYSGKCQILNRSKRQGRGTSSLLQSLGFQVTLVGSSV